MDLKQLLELWKKQFNLQSCDELEKSILIYKDFLQQENKKYNLTRLDKPEIIYDQYFYQSLINFKPELFSNPNMNVLDIGSGSGIPGILLKIIFKNINLYIVESNSKKCKFLTELSKKLNLENVYVFNQRCEDFIKTKRNFFDLITCRAVAELHVLLELSIPGLKINGIGYFLKSSNFMSELKNAEKITQNLDINPPLINEIIYEDKKFVSLEYTKIKENSLIYPRSWKEIISNA